MNDSKDPRRAVSPTRPSVRKRERRAVPCLARRPGASRVRERCQTSFRMVFASARAEPRVARSQTRVLPPRAGRMLIPRGLNLTALVWTAPGADT